MNYRVTLVILFIFSTHLYSQNLDSLFNAKKETLKSITTDEKKIDFLYDCGMYFYSKDINKSAFCFSKALSFLKDKKNTMEGKVLWKLGFIEKNKGNLGASFKYFFEAKDIFKNTNDAERFASIHFDIGYLYHYKKQNDLEIEFYKKGLILSKNQREKIIGKGYLH